VWHIRVLLPEWTKSKAIGEYRLEEKSGASTRGNSSSNSVY